jgi:hypothetical protein
VPGDLDACLDQPPAHATSPGCRVHGQQPQVSLAGEQPPVPSIVRSSSTVALPTMRSPTTVTSTVAYPARPATSASEPK